MAPNRYQNRIELLQGTLDLLILQTLRWGPQHGYGLSQAIQLNSGDILQVDTGSLYPALHRLERQKWISADWKTSENKQRVRVYKLTAAGKKRLLSERSKWAATHRRHRRCPGAGQEGERSMKPPFHHSSDEPNNFDKPDKQRELEEELASHLKLSQQDRQDRGESTQQAAESARREFGNVALVEHVTRDQWRGRWIDELLQDLRFALRTLRKSPGFTAVAILTLALGIGANTSLFSVVNAVLLNPVPYPHPEQLVMLHESKPNFRSGSISYPNFRDWQHDNRSFSSMAVTRGTSFTLTGLGEAEELRAQFISSDYFSLLNVQPVIGRFFASGEDEIGAAPIVLVSADFWHRKLSGSPDVIGKTLNLDGRAFTIVGVAPASFDIFQRVLIPTDVYAPLGQWTNPFLNKREAGLGIHGIGRLKPGVTLEQAVADMQRVTDNLAQNTRPLTKASAPRLSISEKKCSAMCKASCLFCSAQSDSCC